MRKLLHLAIVFLLVAGLVIPQAAFPRQVRASGNIVLQQDFEDGQTGGWNHTSWTPAGDVSVSDAYAVSGSKSLKFSNRASHESTVNLDVTNLLKEGHKYHFSLKVRLGEGSDQIHLGSKIISSLGEQYPWLVGNQAVSASDWTLLESAKDNELEVPAKTTKLLIWIESDPASTSTADIYIDDVIITDVTSGTVPDDGGSANQSVLKADFENGRGDWSRRNGAGGIEVTAADNHTSNGSHSLMTTVSQQYDGPILDILGKMQQGSEYNLSAWVKMAPGQTPTSLRISVQSGESSYSNVSANVTATDGAWVQLSGKFSLTVTPTILKAYVETEKAPASPVSFYLDDFEVALAGGAIVPLPVQTDLDSIAQLYTPYFKIGAAVEPAQLSADKELIDLHYNSLVLENSSKPGSLKPTKDGPYQWAGMDTVAAYAKAHNMDFRLHTLLWHSQAAAWMYTEDDGETLLQATPANKELVLQRIEAYIRDVAQHLHENQITVNAIDVVNEVIDPAEENGYRHSEWFRLTGLDYIRTAFKVAREVFPESKLYINDYNTHDPKKRDYLYNMVKMMRDQEGIPIDGVGHQTHINISGPSIQQISDSIRKFAEAGFDNQITELDVSVYNDSNTVYDTVPENIAAKQGYRYMELFKELVRLDQMGKNADPSTKAYNANGWISNVTFWGVADDHTWLHNINNIIRQDAPFPFDKRFQAKYAYWGLVEAVKTLSPSKLPVNIKEDFAVQGTPDNPQAAAWQTAHTMQTEQAGNLQAGVKTLWDAGHLYVLATVTDATYTPTDLVELYLDDGQIHKYSYPRDHKDIVQTTGGYVLATALPIQGVEGNKLKFDIKVTDKGIDDGHEQGGNGAIVSWSDPRNAQDSDSQGFGLLTLNPSNRIGEAAYGTPVLDGELDSIWSKAPEYETGVQVESANGAVAKAKFRTMWDEKKLYVYAVVTDSLLSDAPADAWNKDSIEIFVDQNNGKTAEYQADDGQYRVNYKNVRSVGGNAAGDAFTSVTKTVYGTGYVVEAAIGLAAITPAEGGFIGFDLQVNNTQGTGVRDSVFIWNDPTGMSYANTSRLGVMKLVKVTDPAGPGSGTIAGGNQSNVGFTGAEFSQAVQAAKEGVITLKVNGSGSKDTPLQVALTQEQLQAAATAKITAVELRTGEVTLVLPLAVLAPSGSAGEAVVSVKKTDPASLPETIRALVGSNDIWDLGLTIGGKPVTAFGSNGTVKVSWGYKLKAGENPGQVVVYYLADDGKAVLVKEAGFNPATGMVELQAAHFSKYAAVAVKVNFTDLGQAAWAEEAVSGMAARGIVEGVSPTAFAPNEQVTREQFLHLLMRTLDLANTGAANSPFKDAEQGAYYEASLAAAAGLGIVNGQEDGVFGIGQAVSRQDMAVMLERALKAAGQPLPVNQVSYDFADQKDISAYAIGAVEKLQQAGLVNGKLENRFDPAGTATRAEAATVLYRLLRQ